MAGVGRSWTTEDARANPFHEPANPSLQEGSIVRSYFPLLGEWKTSSMSEAMKTGKTVFIKEVIIVAHSFTNM